LHILKTKFKILDVGKFIGHTFSLLIYLKENMNFEGITRANFVMEILRGFYMNIIGLGAKKGDLCKESSSL
jgi:hypothetical protein